MMVVVVMVGAERNSGGGGGAVHWDGEGDGEGTRAVMVCVWRSYGEAARMEMMVEDGRFEDCGVKDDGVVGEGMGERQSVGVNDSMGEDQ